MFKTSYRDNHHLTPDRLEELELEEMLHLTDRLEDFVIRASGYLTAAAELLEENKVKSRIGRDVLFCVGDPLELLSGLRDMRDRLEDDIDFARSRIRKAEEPSS